jgi:hypothetical protein
MLKSTYYASKYFELSKLTDSKLRQKKETLEDKVAKLAAQLTAINDILSNRNRVQFSYVKEESSAKETF